ncbi:MAG: DUF45 domain-containing protein [Acidimicrobiia bacterium]|nr:DUF45 domain-containing protein [Acidimicrobiia bacterium]MYA38634.1 DUF45 domain-containing protein [Acidimicrobiia bacterium]MYG92198.1 DUF45 domain-containing protein [Acidimicrobiia bacterium]MYJ16422.1 DUF45 domain-containing protein [Acidimicrobiia bacterium]MYK55862.1 DUF45 domain-containing protein [Acidimicrobiia bacterium]
MTPGPVLIESAVAHGLAHLTVEHHSPELWNLAGHAIPDAQQRRLRLKESGTRLPLWG